MTYLKHEWERRETLGGRVYFQCACGKKRGPRRMEYKYKQYTLPPEHAVDKEGLPAWTILS